MTNLLVSEYVIWRILLHHEDANCCFKMRMDITVFRRLNTSFIHSDIGKNPGTVHMNVSQK